MGEAKRSFVDLFANYPSLQNGLIIHDNTTERPIPNRNLKPRTQGQRGAPMSTRPVHRPGGSQDDDTKFRKALWDPAQIAAKAFSKASDKKENKRPIPRRNSDTSVMEFKIDESRQKDDGRVRDGKSRSRTKKPNRQVDLIDKLDVTGLYGVGMFHHDGPFDACNPQRNRKGHKAAPMRAFAEGSLNNAIGGSGPVNKAIDLDRIHGIGVPGFDDYNTKSATSTETQLPMRKPVPRQRGPAYSLERNANLEQYTSDEAGQILDLKGRDVVHGEETEGLGTSTFLDGAPAPPSALQRREGDAEGVATSSAGLQRKKSLIQKIKGGVKPRGSGDPNTIVPEAYYAFPETSRSPVTPLHTQSAGGRAKMNETNPFFSGIDEFTAEPMGKAVDSDQAAFTTVQRGRTASSPPRRMVRRMTNENTSSQVEGETRSTGGGLLDRVKSLKGGRKARAEKHEQKASG